MIAYILQTGFIWLTLYAFYYYVLRHYTFFNLNRIYLLSSILIGLLLPFIDQVFVSGYSMYQIQYISSIEEINIVATEVQESPSINLLLITYLIGLLLSIARLSYGLFSIFRLKEGAQIFKFDHFTQVITNEKHLPFSFFKWVYISKELPFSEKVDKILKHEMVHIRQKHSLDILIIEIVHCFFWMNPILLLYKRSLKEAHEFYADEVVIHSENVEEYKTMLVTQSPTGVQLQLTHQFFQSQIKNRIQMLNAQRSKKSSLWIYGFMAPVLLGLVVIFSGFKPFEGTNGITINEQISNVNSLDTIPAKSTRKGKSAPPLAQSIEESVYKEVEQMPRFPGCESNGLSDKEREDCSKNKMLQYIYTNVKYPSEAKKMGVEGMAVISFVVKQNGEIADAKIVRDPGSGLGEESKRVVEMMNNMEEKWIPGKQKGKAVSVLYNLPIRFKLDSNDTDDKKK